VSWIKETRYLCWEILNLNNNCKPSFPGWVIGFLIRGSVRVDSFPDAGRCWYEGPGLVFPLNPYEDIVCVWGMRPLGWYALIILVPRWGLVGDVLIIFRAAVGIGRGRFLIILQVSDLVFLGSNPARVTASFHF